MATAAEIKAFINRLGALAVNESNRRIAAGKGFVLPSVCIAQSALETGWGASGLMTRANAFFGIKAGGSWKGKVYTAGTWEVADGEAYNTTANFRAYDSLEASVADYYDLIGNSSRYANALSFGTDRSKWKTPRECITAIWSGGYATDTLYVQKIMNTITARDLAVFDAKIDGISTLPIDYADHSFRLIVKGSLEITDSGRTISINSNTPYAYATDWDNAPSLDGKYTLDINDPDGAVKQIFIAGVIGERTYINGITVGTLVSGVNNKIGFYVIANEWAVSPVDMENVVIMLRNQGAIVSGDEIQKSALAFFVKIE